MVIAYHLIMSAYGFWLTNDPRGSWSESIRKWQLYRFGEETKTGTRHSVAHVSHDWRLRERAKEVLSFPPVHFNGEQAREIGSGFASYVAKSGATMWACPILPEHVHFVVARHTYHVEQIANLMKGEATKQLVAAGQQPFLDRRDDEGFLPPCWGRRCWKVFIDDLEHLERAIKYVEENPTREGKLRQRWSFVMPCPKTYLEVMEETARQQKILTGDPLGSPVRRLNYAGASAAAFCSFSTDSGSICIEPLHFVFAQLEQPRKYRPRALHSFIFEPHCGHGTSTRMSGTFLRSGAGGRASLSFSFSSAGIGLALRHFG